MRTDRSDNGWTLVELIVVLGISAILAAVAIPTLLGSRQGANDQAASARLDAAGGVLQEVWAEYQTFCVWVPGDPTPNQSGCSNASLVAVMNGLQPGTVAGQTNGITSATTPPDPPVALVLATTAVELDAKAVGGYCLYLQYLEAPSPLLAAGTWYATSPADNGTDCSLNLTPVSGWHHSWGQAGA